MTTETSTPTNITPEHREMFSAIVSSNYNNFALFSCYVNGTPAAAIVAVNRDGQAEDYLITPLFVSITGDMVLTDHDGNAVTCTDAPDWFHTIFQCDALEIWPVCDLKWDDETQGPRPFDPTGDNASWCETCNQDKAHFWSVFGHLKTGGLTCLEDFATEAEAIAFAEKLYQNCPHLSR